MRTLIVDNDSENRKALKAMLMGLSECVEALDRSSALALFGNAYADGTPFDLVAVDINMSGMGGTSILKEFRGIESEHRNGSRQEVCILVITALSGRQLEADCLMQGGTDFITKPLITKDFLDKLTQLQLITKAKTPEPDLIAPVSSRKILDTISRKLNKGDFKLPPAPKIAMKIRQLVTCNATIDDVIDLLKQEPSVTTKLISTSNSAYYRGVKKSISLGQAVRRLGIDRSMEVVMSICCCSYFTTNHPAYKKLVENLWWHSLACAHATEIMTTGCKEEDNEDLFSLGLLHDIGRLLLIQVAGDLDPAKHSRMEIQLDELEAMVSAHHRRFGASVLKRWGYPDTFTFMVRHCGSQLALTSGHTAQVLHQANLMAKAAGFGHGVKDDTGIAELLEQQGYPEQHQTELKAKIVARMDQLRYLFG